MRETSDFEIPSTPKAFTRSSTFRVETPWTYASWTTASNACSARRRGCSNDGKVGPRPNLRDRQLDRAHPRVPRPRATAIAVRRPIARALVALGADQPRDLGFHQRLREHTNALPQHVPILLLEELANKRRQIHSGLGHRVNTSVCASPARENSRKDARWPSRCLCRAPTEFPPRPGTLTLRNRAKSESSGVGVMMTEGPFGSRHHGQFLKGTRCAATVWRARQGSNLRPPA